MTEKTENFTGPPKPIKTVFSLEYRKRKFEGDTYALSLNDKPFASFHTALYDGQRAIGESVLVAINHAQAVHTVTLHVDKQVTLNEESFTLTITPYGR